MHKFTQIRALWVQVGKHSQNMCPRLYVTGAPVIPHHRAHCSARLFLVLSTLSFVQSAAAQARPRSHLSFPRSPCDYNQTRAKCCEAPEGCRPHSAHVLQGRTANAPHLLLESTIAKPTPRNHEVESLSGKSWQLVPQDACKKIYSGSKECTSRSIALRHVIPLPCRPDWETWKNTPLC